MLSFIEVQVDGMVSYLYNITHSVFLNESIHHKVQYHSSITSFLQVWTCVVTQHNTTQQK